MQVLKSNKWQAARYGLEGRFVYPLIQKKISMKEAAGEIFTKAATAMEQLGTSHYLPMLKRIVETGTSSTQQRKIFNQQNDFTVIIKELHPKFWQ
jgi:carboxylate-amine ligase